MINIKSSSLLILLTALAFGAVACGRIESKSAAPLVAGSDVIATRYALNNQCWALRSNSTSKFVALSGGKYSATASSLGNAEPFYLKPSALGKYLLYGHDARLLSSGSPVSSLDLSSANDTAEWTAAGVGDTTQYPPTPSVNTEPDPAQVAAYRRFVDPNGNYSNFTLFSQVGGGYLAVDGSGVLNTVASVGPSSAFAFQSLPPTLCAEFPEAQDNTTGASFSGARSDGRVLGYADSHLHATSTTFLGGAKPGWIFHKFGVTHALADCSAEHGPNGMRDVVGALFTGNATGHDTHGWPTFPSWPSRTAVTHESVYWKWLERAWKSGLRVISDYAVDNRVLCELQRNVAGTPTLDCNEMSSARRQIGTSYALQDYVDGQYGGRGAGWYRIVTTPTQARQVIAQGKLAVLLGIEISNLLNCSVTYNPISTQDAYQETGDLISGGQRYGCAMTETGASNEILTQLQQLKDLGVSGLFTVHEFDNAFGGSDIFDGLVLNLGNHVSTGGLANADQVAALAHLQTPAQYEGVANLQLAGTPTGEFWSTYDCPTAADAESGGGFIFPPGAVMTNLGPPAPACPYAGRGGRHGGKSACYPAAPQCNGRLLTPMGLYTFTKIMNLGFIFEIDHLAIGLKDQLLDLAAAQTPNYPTISGHAWSNLSWRQAQRIYAGGGIVYPSLNNTTEFIGLWKTLKSLWRQSGAKYEFGFGFGSDTNGMSPQMAPRSTIAPGKELTYPFTLFTGPIFKDLAQFNGLSGVIFDQPAAKDPSGNGRTWSEDVDGNAQYGMAADFVQELRIEGSAEQMGDLYNSAEAYLQFWERTQTASTAVQRKGIVIPSGLLHPAPVSP